MPYSYDDLISDPALAYLPAGTVNPYERTALAGLENEAGTLKYGGDFQWGQDINSMVGRGMQALTNAYPFLTDDPQFQNEMENAARSFSRDSLLRGSTPSDVFAKTVMPALRKWQMEGARRVSQGVVERRLAASAANRKPFVNPGALDIARAEATQLGTLLELGKSPDDPAVKALKADILSLGEPEQRPGTAAEALTAGTSDRQGVPFVEDAQSLPFGSLYRNPRAPGLFRKDSPTAPPPGSRIYIGDLAHEPEWSKQPRTGTATSKSAADALASSDFNYVDSDLGAMNADEFSEKSAPASSDQTRSAPEDLISPWGSVPLDVQRNWQPALEQSPATIPAAAIAYLKSHPELAADFDDKYGQGQSAKILGE